MLRRKLPSGAGDTSQCHAHCLTLVSVSCFPCEDGVQLSSTCHWEGLQDLDCVNYQFGGYLERGLILFLDG